MPFSTAAEIPAAGVVHGIGKGIEAEPLGLLAIRAFGDDLGAFEILHPPRAGLGQEGGVVVGDELGEGLARAVPDFQAVVDHVEGDPRGGPQDGGEFAGRGAAERFEHQAADRPGLAPSCC